MPSVRARDRPVDRHFDDEESLRAGAETFAAMDPSETPGTRASVDTSELEVDRAL